MRVRNPLILGGGERFLLNPFRSDGTLWSTKEYTSTTSLVGVTDSLLSFNPINNVVSTVFNASNYCKNPAYFNPVQHNETDFALLCLYKEQENGPILTEEFIVRDGQKTSVGRKATRVGEIQPPAQPIYGNLLSPDGRSYLDVKRDVLLLQLNDNKTRKVDTHIDLNIGFSPDSQFLIGRRDYARYTDKNTGNQIRISWDELNLTSTYDDLIKISEYVSYDVTTAETVPLFSTEQILPATVLGWAHFK